MTQSIGKGTVGQLDQIYQTAIETLREAMRRREKLAVGVRSRVRRRQRRAMEPSSRRRAQQQARHREGGPSPSLYCSCRSPT